MAMETRKLQRVGGGTYTVSIPKAWAVDNGLEAGAEVHLYAHADGSIVVRSSAKDGGELGRIALDVDGEDPALVTRALRAAHAAGYGTVTLRPRESFTDDQLRAARRTTRHLVGTEVVAEGPQEITLRNFLDASDVSIRQSVVQLQFVALSAHRRGTDAFVGGSGGDVERLRERADEADRLAEMVARHFGRSLVSMEEVDRLGVSRPRQSDYHATARELARVADLGVSLGRAAVGLSGPLPEPLTADVRGAADASRRVVDDAATAVLEGSGVDAATAVLDRYDEAVACVEALDRALFDDPSPAFDGTTAEARALTRALDDVARTAAVGGEIAEVALRAATRGHGERTGR